MTSGIVWNVAVQNFPFSSLPSTSNFLACYTSADSKIMQWKDLGSDTNSSLLLKPSTNLEFLVSQLNNLS